MQRARKVGVYDLGSEPVELWIRSGRGGATSARPLEGKLARMDIGVDHDDFPDVLAVLVHEAVEYVMVRVGVEYVPFMDFSQESANRLIVETHCQHSEVCARAGIFMGVCVFDLHKAWKQWRKEQKC